MSRFQHFHALEGLCLRTAFEEQLVRAQTAGSQFPELLAGDYSVKCELE